MLTTDTEKLTASEKIEYKDGGAIRAAPGLWSRTLFTTADKLIVLITISRQYSIQIVIPQLEGCYNEFFGAI